MSQTKTQLVEGLDLAAAPADSLVIDSSGRVGIGESTPEALLEIRGASTVGTNTGHIILSGDSATNDQGPQIVFSESGSSSSFAGAYIGHQRKGTNSTGNLVFGVRTTAGDANTVPEEAMRIDEQKRVGIGTTSPGSVLDTNGSITISGKTTDLGTARITHHTNNNLYIRGGTNGAILSDYDSSNAIGCSASDFVYIETNSAERFRIDSSGRFLVGTSSARSTYYGAGISAGINVEAAGNLASSNRSISVVNGYSSSTDGDPILYLGRTRSDSIGGTTSVQSDDQVGRVAFMGSDGTNMLAAAQIQGVIDGTPGANDMPGRLVFSTTADGATSPTTRMQIKANGQVGIGGVPDSSALLGIEAASTTELSNSSGLYNQSNPAFFQIKNTTDGISDPECGIILQPRNSSNGSVALYAKRTGSFTSDLIYRVRTGSATSQENIRFLHGGGITFNGDTAAANALDDYEEGTHTCTASNGVTLNSSINQISYTKIGRMVTVGGQIQVSNSNSNSVLIVSLPFACKNNAEGDALYTGSLRLFSAGIPSGTVYCICHSSPGQAEVIFRGVRDNNSTIDITATTNGYYMFQLTYPVA